jgi:Protein of unknown function (DUF2585)
MNVAMERASGARVFPLVAAAAIVLAQVVVLVAFGQPLICTCGTVRLWQGVVVHPETSQQLSDWYTFSHVIHGCLFYALLWLVAPRMPVLWRFALAIGIEVGWEVLENTPMVIERYRQSALAVGYSGDSVLNSVADTAAAALGFLFAARARLPLVIGFVVAAEIFTAVMVRDNLTLNIIQLIYPSTTISNWQAGG